MHRPALLHGRFEFLRMIKSRMSKNEVVHETNSVVAVDGGQPLRRCVASD